MHTQRRSVLSESPFEARYHFSRAVRVGSRIVVSGTAPIWPDGSFDPDPAAQMHRCLAIIDEALGRLGANLNHIVLTRIYIVDRADAETVGRAHSEVFKPPGPVATMVVVNGLLDSRWRVEVEAEAEVPEV
jgi:enamine deaminase RidA (YjgF/YER057c/UK114 family)